MLAANFRELWNKFILSFGKASRKLGLTPNFWTLFSLFMAFLAGITLYQVVGSSDSSNKIFVRSFTSLPPGRPER